MQVPSKQYTEYIHSRSWEAVKATYKARFSWICFICGTADGALHLHHKTYERFGKEELTDLIPLCKICHSLCHELLNNHSTEYGEINLWNIADKIKEKVQLTDSKEIYPIQEKRPKKKKVKIQEIPLRRVRIAKKDGAVVSILTKKVIKI